MMTRIILAAVLAAALSGCNFDSSSDSPAGLQSAPTSPTADNPASPVIKGTPATVVAAGSTYTFTPSASGGGKLQFSIQNKPSWAAFSSSTGSLTGKPGASQAGMYPGILISVSDGAQSAALPSFSVTVTASGAVSGAPIITGSPATTVVIGNEYSFSPAASAASGQALTFSIANKPAWASFDETTGQLSGTPGAADIGTTAGIVISVSDGEQSASLPAFSLTVSQMGGGTATLSWMPPQQNTDGTPLTNLAGYHVYYGTNASSLSKSVTLASPGIATYMVTDLSPGTWYFAVKAYNTANVESVLSAKVSKTIL